MIFHRIIPGFVIQGGDGSTARSRRSNRARRDGGPGYKFEDEPFKRRLRARHARDGQRRPEHERLAVLHLPPDLTGKLPKNYTIFGQVTKGMDVVDKIVARPAERRDLPDQPVAMTKVAIFEDEALARVASFAEERPAFQAAPEWSGGNRRLFHVALAVRWNGDCSRRSSSPQIGTPPDPRERLIEPSQHSASRTTFDVPA